MSFIFNKLNFRVVKNLDKIKMYFNFSDQL